ncbi:hypothetical protein LTR09_012388 [Extremus antarcticus]|uniref:Uncharacterized protein n=1 Tax=Extremus antarcticus TaxID=702011 RepID=A0AAJ0D9Y1_9PEZI|nr:hypothetical protein LTR09_012388 [Extremus antarcticus]
MGQPQKESSRNRATQEFLQRLLPQTPGQPQGKRWGDMQREAGMDDADTYTRVIQLFLTTQPLTETGDGAHTGEEATAAPAPAEENISRTSDRLWKLVTYWSNRAKESSKKAKQQDYPLTITALGTLRYVDAKKLACGLPKYHRDECLSTRFTIPLMLHEIIQHHRIEGFTLQCIYETLGYPVTTTAVRKDWSRVTGVLPPPVKEFVNFSGTEYRLDLGRTKKRRKVQSGTLASGIAPVRPPAAAHPPVAAADTSRADDGRRCAESRPRVAIPTHASKGAAFQAAPAPSGHPRNGYLDTVLNPEDRRSPDTTQAMESHPVLSIFSGPGRITFSRAQLASGASQQPRWDKDGHRILAQKEESGISAEIIPYLETSGGLLSTIDAMVASGALTETDAHLYSTEPDRSVVVTSKRWLDSLAFICHICPREQALDTNFQAATRALLPQIGVWLRYFERTEESAQLSWSLKLSFIDVCIAIALRRVSESSLAVTVARKIGGKDLLFYQIAALAAAESTLLRLEAHANVEKSEKVLASVLAIPFDYHTSNTRDCCWMGRVVLSQVENCMQLKNWLAAEKHIGNIQTVHIYESCPPMGLELVAQKNTVLGRLYQYRGYVKEAKAQFQLCLDLARADSRPNTHNLIRHMADLHCESGEGAEAEALLRGPLAELAEDTRPYMRLALPMADAEMLLGRDDAAEERLQPIDQFYCERYREFAEFSAKFSANDQVDHVRALFLRTDLAVRAGDLRDAIAILGRALQAVEKYESFTATNYYCRQLLLYRAELGGQVGDRTLRLAEADFSRAEDDIRRAELCDTNAQHLIPSRGTFKQQAVPRIPAISRVAANGVRTV